MRELLDSYKLEDALLRLMETKGNLPFTLHLVEIARKQGRSEENEGTQILPAALATACMDRNLQRIDIIAQLDVSKFAIIQMQPNNSTNFTNWAASICSELAAQDQLNRPQYNCYLGTVEFAEKFSSPFQLMQRAEIALSRQTRKSTTGQTIDDSLPFDFANNPSSITQALCDAIKQEQFELFYQPIVTAKSQAVTQYEALIRWKQKPHTYIPPLRFIPAAERTGVIVEIGRWALEKACRQILAQDGRVGVAVNISPSEFLTSDVSASVEHALEETGLHPRRLTIELTENVFMSFSEAIIEQFERISEMGVSLSLDDFGMGYSSLSRIHALPIKSIKIDRSLVAPIDQDARSRKVVKSIFKMASDLNLLSVAEGVETQRQAEFLDEAGASLLQGHYFGPPLPLETAFATTQPRSSAAC